MTNFSDAELLRGILRNNNIVIKYIYKTYFYKVSLFVCSNKGDENDANDIFQEAIVVIYRKLKSNSRSFKDKSFESNLYAISRFLWLKELEIKRDTIIKVQDVTHYTENIFDDDFEEIVLKNERYKLYQDHFEKLGKDCQKILKLYFEKVSLKEIADRLGLMSEEYAKKRKHQCKEYLVRSIKQDTEFKKIIDNDL